MSSEDRQHASVGIGSSNLPTTNRGSYAAEPRLGNPNPAHLGVRLRLSHNVECVDECARRGGRVVSASALFGSRPRDEEPLLKDLIEELNLADWSEIVVGLAIVAVAALVSYFVVRRLIAPVIRRVVLKTEGGWDDILLDTAVLRRVALFAPAIVVLAGVPQIPSLASGWVEFIEPISGALLILFIVLALSALITAAANLYATLPIRRRSSHQGLRADRQDRPVRRRRGGARSQTRRPVPVLLPQRYRGADGGDPAHLPRYDSVFRCVVATDFQRHGFGWGTGSRCPSSTPTATSSKWRCTP